MPDDTSDIVPATETLYELADLTSEPLYAVDSDGQFQLVNEAFVDLTGYDRETLRGEQAASILHEADRDEWRRRIQLLRSGDGTESERWVGRIVTNRGTEIPIEWEFTVPDGDDAAIVGLARDVREGQRQEQKLNILNRALRHNIRNQMNIIIGKAATLQEVEDDGYRAVAEKIEEIGQNVVNISDKARKAQEHVGLPPDEVCRRDLVETTERVVTKFSISYPKARVDTELPDSAPVRAPPSVEVALTELLENAVIHHPSGNGRVTVTVEFESNRTHLRVLDECEPVPEQVRQTIDRGAEQPLHHNDGLGLWIVRWVVDSVDGELTFDRRPDDVGNAVTLSFERSDD